ncbi:MAG TPA: undecaprenyl-diphosphate phosphatase [Kiritimatiellia bacterium]|nr:undecaprenyl-diphosphate phosphatase [Kiritimatiellia bacterium]HMO97510.1 undecaprenyl-diphosphate phosphatase [Kiritimatiellia bacterium]HMP97147.1 undecaprenyl-diphosphate phosphatase [Kiritimatiellia bacterium]
MPDIVKAFILGIVEGLTEFLPVSSTGHLIIVSELIDFTGREAATFNVFIQLGAILAVLWYFRDRFRGLLTFRDAPGFTGRRGLLFLFLTTLPALVAGYLAHGFIKEYLFSSKTVAMGLAFGAVWILLTEKFYRQEDPKDIDQLTWITALGIGIFQCLAMWPGMSRSACTILGGMFLGLRRRAATEYSFFAAVPMMMAATMYDLYSEWSHLRPESLAIFAVGFVAAFVSALAAVAFFIRFVSRHTFTPFAWYRLVVAALLFWWVYGA